MVPLRHFQADLEAAIYQEWQTKQNVLAVSATGSGKTVVGSKILHDYQGASVAIAHRRELVSQISVALARNGVRHRIIAPKSVQHEIASLHMLEVKRNYVDRNARVAVAGVDTLINMDANDPWFRSVGLWWTDEAHHLLVKNKWGAAAAMFPNAHGLGVTATPMRADGRGLGRHADGVFDTMVVAPNMRDLITMGYLTDYKIIAPPSDIDLSDVPVGESGEYVQVKLAAAVHKSRITGDAVAAYLQHARGKLGVTFSVDVEAATEQAAAYRSAGIPSEVITAKTPDGLRLSILRRFKAREILQLCNVDLFGEGYDLPAIEVVSMARPTASFTLYCQQFGRGLRLMISDALNATWESYTPEQRRAHIAASGKPAAIIIDHVGNYLRHGLPDSPRVWSLDRRERRSRSTPTDVIPLRSCPQCTGAYERTYSACPYCGFKPVPAGRGSPEQVDGDLVELDPEVLAFLRGELAKGESGFVPVPAGATPEVIGACHRRHREHQAAQATLRASMMLWGGYQKSLGRDESEAQRRFYFKFNMDVANAMLLGRADAEALTARIDADLLTMTTVTGNLLTPTNTF